MEHFHFFAYFSAVLCIQYNIDRTLCAILNCPCGFAEGSGESKVNDIHQRLMRFIHNIYIILIHRPPACYVLYRVDGKLKSHLEWPIVLRYMYVVRTGANPSKYAK